MGKAKIRKKLEGYKKQLIKHISKFREAEERGGCGKHELYGKRDEGLHEEDGPIEIKNEAKEKVNTKMNPAVSSLISLQ
ncbi:MAG TPA: hypothetical protein VJB08_06310 [Candidatus Nanoarchaeia archaeon]|nr:hypothetical protein [Candidatus Nanoarchaeia archaeon]